MIKYLFSVEDVKAQCFGSVFCDVSEQSAIRAFGDAITLGKGNTPLETHPEDFILYCVGKFNDSIGQVSLPDGDNYKKVLCYGSDFTSLNTQSNES